MSDTRTEYGYDPEWSVMGTLGNLDLVHGESDGTAVIVKVCKRHGVRRLGVWKVWECALDGGTRACCRMLVPVSE